MTADENYLKNELYSLVKSDSSIFDFLQEGSLDGMWYWDLEKPEYEWMSPRFWTLLGYDPNEKKHLTSEWQDLIFPEDLEIAIDNFNKHCSDPRHPYDQVVRYRHKNGSTIWVRCRGLAIRNDKGKPVRMLGAHTDLTSQKQAEEDLKRKSSLFENFFNKSFQFAIVLDAKGIITEMNELCMKFYSSYAVNAIGSPLWDAGWWKQFPDTVEKTKKAIDLANKGQVTTDEVRFIDPKNKIHHGIRTFTPIADESGKIVQITVVGLDNTERKQAEERLQELEERFRLTFYTSPDSVNINKMDGTYLEINEGFIQLTGYTREDVIGKTSDDINIWDIPEDRERLIKGLQKDGYVRNLESRFLMKDGSCKIALMSAAIIKLKGEPHILSITRDITDLRKTEHDKLLLERQLQQAQKMESVGRLAGGVAHDFNNMLSVILGHAELAMEELDRDQPIFNDLQNIRQAAKHSTDITRQLLAFARKQIVSPKVIDLNETVAGMLKMLLRLIGEDIDLAWLPGKGLWPIKIDPSQIDQILANLCVNARDAIPGVGKITVETGNCSLNEEYCSTHAGFVPGQYVKIGVSDNGIGMDEETVSHIFEPFFTTKSVNEGTGLGLATIYGIVKQNNGFVYVYSEQGQGTTFSIYLPRHMGKTDTEKSESTAEPTMQGDETILLVEDEPTILNITSTMLQRLGYSVLAAGTPGEAVRQADAHSGEIHLVLTDVIMPEMNGRILTEKLMVNRPGLKCLFMSGYTANVISHHGVLDDGVNFIQKPFAKRDLAEKIRLALDKG